MEDVIYKSHVDFEYYQRIDQMFLNLTGGQDGSIYYTLDIIDNEIILKYFIDDSAFIETDESNSHFLCIDPYLSVANYYTYPNVDLISSFNYFDYFGEGNTAFILIHLKDEFYLIAFDGRMYLYDAPNNKVKKEMIIQEHEPKPIKEFYPRLSDEGLMTDIVSAYRYNNVIGFTTLNNIGFHLHIDDVLERV